MTTSKVPVTTQFTLALDPSLPLIQPPQAQASPLITTSTSLRTKEAGRARKEEVGTGTTSEVESARHKRDRQTIERRQMKF